jgi:hypothetical protein
MKIKDLVFTGLNGQVAALDRDSGEIVWHWVSPKPRSGYVTLLLDKDRLLVAVSGYLYCLDPLTGEPLWFNPLKGFGTELLPWRRFAAARTPWFPKPLQPTPRLRPQRPQPPPERLDGTPSRLPALALIAILFEPSLKEISR